VCTRRSGPDVKGRVVTITNRNLSIEDDQWICEPLKRVEMAARTAYYVTRLLRYLEL
jgi:hypothetical protein